MPAGRSELVSELRAQALQLKDTHLRKLVTSGNASRESYLFREHFQGPAVDGGARPVNLGITADFTRQKLNEEAVAKLLQFASEQCQLQTKILAMQSGDVMNATEGRAVLHTALRIQDPGFSASNGNAQAEAETASLSSASSSSPYASEISSEVLRVRREIRDFAEQVRSGKWLGCTGKELKDVISVGIGGSYLGVEFVLEALKTEERAMAHSSGRRTQFLANVDPIDIRRALAGFDPETTLVIICSKTFTTAETILNAECVKQWMLDGVRRVLKKSGSADLSDSDIVSKHVVACSTNIPLTQKFGIQKTFGFWDWVGGRFSVCSAIGILPLTLHFGPDIVESFLSGARQMDEHFFSAPLAENLPVLMGLVAFWNRSFLNFSTCAILPYCQALHRFTAHIQQLDMESNGKLVRADTAERVEGDTGAIYFGEPGTNAQHSFYQLLHQGTTVIPSEFIGFTESQNAVTGPGRELSNHDELMANFFAQPNALALGQTKEEVVAKNGDITYQNGQLSLVPHKCFPGDRPSTMLLFDGKCDARAVGMLLALYEHRTAVQGWLWGINSFDQYGVELGKVLAKDIVGTMKQHRSGSDMSGAGGPTSRLLGRYLKKSSPY
ncbi:unnamed protein product [Amoebophrya sp. A25]|nr:unnamed protein product [Amoebophrya sp. A25]|eukprot:GSA25T00026390001.1